MIWLSVSAQLVVQHAWHQQCPALQLQSNNAGTGSCACTSQKHTCSSRNWCTCIVCSCIQAASLSSGTVGSSSGALSICLCAAYLVEHTGRFRSQQEELCRDTTCSLSTVLPAEVYWPVDGGGSTGRLTSQTALLSQGRQASLLGSSGPSPSSSSARAISLSYHRILNICSSASWVQMPSNEAWAEGVSAMGIDSA